MQIQGQAPMHTLPGQEAKSMSEDVTENRLQTETEKGTETETETEIEPEPETGIETVPGAIPEAKAMLNPPLTEGIPPLLTGPKGAGLQLLVVEAHLPHQLHHMQRIPGLYT